MSLSLTSGVAIAGVGIVRLSHYKALFGFPTESTVQQQCHRSLSFLQLLELCKFNSDRHGR